MKDIPEDAMDKEEGSPRAYIDSHMAELRLFLEDICCDLCQYQYALRADCAPGPLWIKREWHLGEPNAFADIRVEPPGLPPYFVEIKFGYSDTLLLRHIERKYGRESDAIRGASKLVVVMDVDRRKNWKSLEQKLRAVICPKLDLEVWSESHLQSLVAEQFGVKIGLITDQALIDARDQIENVKGFHAFGGDSLETYRNDPLRSELMWHLGPIRLRELREHGRLRPRDILPPGLYRGAAVLMADLSAFSSFVRDTHDSRIIRECLTAFYTKSRFQILNGGGMFHQVIGDAVLAYFGIPEADPASADHCLSVAKSLVNIGDSVSNHWQRRIDRVQPTRGLHVGLTVGDVEILSLRPFSRTRIGTVSDSINMAARLVASSTAGEITVSNSFFRRLSTKNQEDFVELEPVDARNLGRINAWKLHSSST